MCFVTAPFFDPVALAQLLVERSSAPRGSGSATFATVSSSFGVSRRSSRIAELRTSSRIFFESSVVILLRDLDEELGDELPRLLERRDALLLGPVGEAAGPELVVLVEVPLLALREVLAAALQPVLERGERLVAVDVDPLLLGLDLCSRGRSGPSCRFATSTVVTIEAAK